MGLYVAACAWKMPERLVAAGIISGLAPVDRVRRELNRLHRLSCRVGASGYNAGQSGPGTAGPERPAPSGVDHQEHVSGGVSGG